jgi:hypothetical protein
MTSRSPEEVEVLARFARQYPLCQAQAMLEIERVCAAVTSAAPVGRRRRRRSKSACFSDLRRASVYSTSALDQVGPGYIWLRGAAAMLHWRIFHLRE